MAALYLSGAVGVLLAAFARRRSEIRLFVMGFVLATGLILVLTVLHWSEFMDDHLPHRVVWIFALPALLGQLYACFFLTFAVGAALAARETEPRAIRIFTVSSLALMLLVRGASLLHLDRFKPQPVTWLWFASFALGGCAFAVALIRVSWPRGWRPTTKMVSR